MRVHYYRFVNWVLRRRHYTDKQIGKLTAEQWPEPPESFDDFFEGVNDIHHSGNIDGKLVDMTIRLSKNIKGDKV